MPTGHRYDPGTGTGNFGAYIDFIAPNGYINIKQDGTKHAHIQCKQ